MSTTLADLTSTLDARLRAAVHLALAGTTSQDVDDDPQLRRATRPEHGHLQTNLALRLAATTGGKPRDVATALLAHLDVADLADVEVAGPGFLNLRWRPEVLARLVTTLLTDEHLGVPRPQHPRRVVVDHSSPNVAKQMHVGHLRSTVIGDALARVLAFAGHDVVRQNHLGDWGTQFGMLIEQVEAEHLDVGALDLAALDALYRRARAHFETDPAFAEAARRRVVALQSGDEATLTAWQSLVAVSVEAFDALYSRLGVGLTHEHVAGESSYNAALPGVVSDLQDAGLVTESDGALCAYLDGFTARDGSLLPMLVRKADGGFGYDATDLAALRHRVAPVAEGGLGADQVVYVVDARQSLHFEQVLALARSAGWLPDGVQTQHVAFGTVLGEDGRPFKTRSGETVSLDSLLDDAEAAARAAEWGGSMPAEERDAVARAVGVGAVKYADLSHGRTRDYRFSLARMVAMDGDTGPYLQYAHARLCSLLARAGDPAAPAARPPVHPAEERLALALAAFPGAVTTVAETLEPHHLCAALHDVAVALSRFYEACPVLRAEGEEREGRLALAAATRSVLATGLGLLGIEAPERM
ncbi:arginine--tRNA ligase [Nocardioides bruguierae]|uniref:Arginine--tRNA ligase n=1 Tax=Nocardioides bruguierae TaxID=2945102 RepID=A0A9X2D732_9ACTN|nr:arginine--tRNA ligase [Nocardioides bruguierae]MCM0620345.1 arginine--tRNA ligase [Nocardioides bruguierae]